jgi:hypothetical protein
MRSLKGDHEVLDGMLNQLVIQLGKPDLPWAFESLDLFWASLAIHIRAENICLFPAILNAPRDRFGKRGVPSYEEARAIIEQLKNDHNFLMTQLGDSMKGLRAMILHPEYSVGISISELRDRIATVGDRLYKHKAVEEEKVYLWPAVLLNEDSLEQLNAGVATEIQNMPSRFAWVS